MNPERTIPALMFIMICVLTVTGCISQPGTGNHKNNASVNASTFTTAFTPAQTQCPPQTNATPWIKINPIGDHYISDIFEISGTTNLDADKIISIDIIQSYFSPKGQDYFTGFHSYSKIVGGDCGINRWSISVNLSEFIPFEYFVHVSEANEMINSSAVFKVFESSSIAGQMNRSVPSNITKQ